MVLRFGNVILRALEPDDASALWNLAIQSDAGQDTTPYWRPWTQGDFREYIANTNDSTRIQFGIAVLEDHEADDATTVSRGSLIGTVELHRISWIHGTGEIGIIIWPKDRRAKGLGTCCVHAICTWAFNVLRLRKLIAKTFNSNVASQRCFEKAGFMVEGRLSRQYFREGVEEDAVVLGLHRDDYVQPNPPIV